MTGVQRNQAADQMDGEAQRIERESEKVQRSAAKGQKKPDEIDSVAWMRMKKA